MYKQCLTLTFVLLLNSNPIERTKRQQLESKMCTQNATGTKSINVRSFHRNGLGKIVMKYDQEIKNKTAPCELNIAKANNRCLTDVTNVFKCRQITQKIKLHIPGTTKMKSDTIIVGCEVVIFGQIWLQMHAAEQKKDVESKLGTSIYDLTLMDKFLIIYILYHLNII